MERDSLLWILRGERGGVTIDPSLLGRLANLEIPFVLDLNPPGPPAEVLVEFRD